MKQIVRISITAMMIISFAACGGGAKEDKSALGDKKAELAKLQNEQTKLAAQISKLEEEIAKADPAAAAKTAKLVEVLTVANQKFEHFIELQGKIDADNISYVSPRGQPGLVKALFIKKGDAVKKGQLLIKLDDAIIRQNIAAAKQGLEQIKTQLAFAKNLYQRQKNLWDQNIGTEVQVISAKNNVDALEAQLKTAEENVKAAGEQWATTNIYADVNGIADQVNVRVGETFTGFSGNQPQIQIVNTSSLKIVADIPETYLAKVKTGNPVEAFIPDVNNKLIKAKVSVISQAINANSRGFIMEAKIPADAQLKPNMVAQVKIQDYASQSAIVIPLTTIQTDEKGKFVFVLTKENNKTVSRKKPIIIGEIYGDMVEVKAGLAAGDQVIVKGYQSLYDGQSIITGL
ncbi:MAG: efflux RND transporter periplasmic adaptor subunit [Sphingobacteriales bacterium]|nr:efflux RND transporter periplasmic adaptor subunit [Sphingobacteriales bacterium]